MEEYYKQDELEIGLDEAGSGCLMGPVFAAGVIMNDIGLNPPPYPIKILKMFIQGELRNIEI